MHEEILIVRFAKEDASTVAIGDRSGAKHENANDRGIIDAAQGRALREQVADPDYSGCGEKRSENSYPGRAERIWISSRQRSRQHGDDERRVDVPFRFRAFAKRNNRERNQPYVKEKNLGRQQTSDGQIRIAARYEQVRRREV